MSNSRTNSLHERLPVELRRQVEEALIEQPPGLETYAKVHAHFQLDGHNVSIKALERYGGYLRTLARNQWIRQVGDVLVGENVSPRIAGLIRGRLFELLATEEAKLSDLLKAALTYKSLGDAVIKSEEWEAKKRAAEQALAKAEADGKHDPAKAMADLADKIKTIYGLS